MIQFFLSFLALFNTNFSSSSKLVSPITEELMVVNAQEAKPRVKTEVILSSQTIDLSQRDKNSFVNQVFKDNILLALSYLDSFVLRPGEAFAFHDNFLDKYKDKVVKTVGSEFNSSEGYRSSGLVVGDGVCHLASLINWAASEAGLTVQAEVDHDFRSIPGVPREYGTSIKYSRSAGNSQNQNLYITNNLDFPVEFRFGVYRDTLGLEIVTYR